MNPVQQSSSHPSASAEPESTDSQNKSRKMRQACLVCAGAIALSTVLGITLSFFLIYSEQRNLHAEFNEFKSEVLREFAAQRLHRTVVNESMNVIRRKCPSEIEPATNREPDKPIEGPLDPLVEIAKKLNDKLEEFSAIVNNSKHVDSKLESLEIMANKFGVIDNVFANLPNENSKVAASNSSLQLVIDEVEGMGTEMRTQQNNCSQKGNLNSSLDISIGLASTTSPDLNTSGIIVEGIIVAADDGITTVTLPSLQQTNITNGFTQDVAFDWNSRKVYWSRNGIKKCNLDGTNVELLAAGGWNTRLLAVDSITGNFYYRNGSFYQDIIVCCRSGEKCSVVATNQIEISSFALYLSKGLMFWTNDTSVMRADMDGSNARVIRSESKPSVVVDETSKRLYLVLEQSIVTSTMHGNSQRFTFKFQRYIASCDVNGNDWRVLWNETDSTRDMKISGDFVYLSNMHSILSGSKADGKLSLITTVKSRIQSIALYGSNANLRKNPCQGAPCSHLCVLKLESFACLCPKGQRLDQDAMTCV